VRGYTVGYQIPWLTRSDNKAARKMYFLAGDSTGIWGVVHAGTHDWISPKQMHTDII